MANPSAANITRVSGKLCKDPTNLALPFPHGGTALGVIRDGEFQIKQRRFGLIAEEYGCEVEYYTSGFSPVLAVVVRELDNDWVNATFLSAAAGAQTARPLVTATVKTNEQRAGASLQTLECGIYVSPLVDTEPAIYLPSARPIIDEAARVNMSRGTEFGILCLFLGTPDTNGVPYQMGTARDIVL